MTTLTIENLTSTTVALSTFRGKQVLVTTFAARKPQREAARMGLDNQRIRFNWGYHDGASDVRNGYRTAEQQALFIEHHFDRAYADGYRAGLTDQAAGKYANNSNDAWQSSNRTDDFAGWR